MAAGEAWIFDNWCQHRVENPSSEARIHLVVDTAGTSAFWRLVAQGQTENFGQQNPDSRLIACDPAARPKLLIERFNAAPVMPPARRPITNSSSVSHGRTWACCRRCASPAPATVRSPSSPRGWGHWRRQIRYRCNVCQPVATQ
jgi:hypothetical protein